jgi:hypothetical protein
MKSSNQKKQPNKSNIESTQNSWILLKNAIQGAEKLVPLIVFSCCFLTFFTIVLGLTYSSITYVVTLLIILFTSIFVYMQSKNYGESALALSAGLLTLFSLEWTHDKFAIFILAWVTFTLAVIIISGVNSASKYQQLYINIALILDLDNFEETQNKIRSIIEGIESKDKILGIIQRSEIIEIFAYRKLPLEFMEQGLSWVITLYAISKADYKSIALFISDIYKIFPPEQNKKYSRLLDSIYNRMRESPVSPIEFINAFNSSRKLVLSKQLEPKEYFDYLSNALENGVEPDDIYQHIKDDLMGK